MSVPLVPRPATKWVISGQSRQISGPVRLVVRPGVGLVGVLVEERPLGVLVGQGLGPAHGAVRALVARRVRMISAPNISSSWRRSIETFSGSTILIG